MDPVSDNNLFKLFLSKISNSNNDLSKISSKYCNDSLKELDSIEKNHNLEFANKEEILYNFSQKTVKEANETVDKLINDKNIKFQKSGFNFKIFLPSGYHETLADVKNFIRDLREKMKLDPTFKGTKSSTLTTQEEQINLIKSQNEILGNLSQNIQNLNYNINSQKNLYNSYYDSQYQPNNTIENNNEDGIYSIFDQTHNIYNDSNIFEQNQRKPPVLFQLMVSIIKNLIARMIEMQYRLLKIEEKIKNK